MELKVIDSNGDTVQPNEEGDLLSRGPAQFVGYLKHIEGTIAEFQRWLVYHGRSRVYG